MYVQRVVVIVKTVFLLFEIITLVASIPANAQRAAVIVGGMAWHEGLEVCYNTLTEQDGMKGWKSVTVQ